MFSYLCACDTNNFVFVCSYLYSFGYSIEQWSKENAKFQANHVITHSLKINYFINCVCSFVEFENYVTHEFTRKKQTNCPKSNKKKKIKSKPKKIVNNKLWNENQFVKYVR